MGDVVKFPGSDDNELDDLAGFVAELENQDPLVLLDPAKVNKVLDVRLYSTEDGRYVVSYGHKSDVSNTTSFFGHDKASALIDRVYEKLGNLYERYRDVEDGD